MLRHCKMAVLAIVIACAGLAFAHDDDYHGGSPQAGRHGYEHGYRDGFHRAREDRNAGAAYNYKTEDWEHADRGYANYMGDHGQYKKGYRDGYKDGYEDAASGRAGRFGDIYGGHGYVAGDNDADDRPIPAADRYDERHDWSSQDAAYDIGYSDGVAWARDDMKKHKSFNPQRTRGYRMADHGYHDGYGNKDDYKRVYRDGFVRGYSDYFGK